ncbi:uncharacterized protein LOC129587404 [Paramacrobiotus metropolitanus]|uniref:uncharacterized protein LOC129587404 n=1 Tax=Paramacrobiotus metropolitanus TaxID=2943436 RepID=UPI00244581CD|nr:uncharacterized protein LOC129587404 [Paramacrobiotus metropolitanus]
MLVVINVGSFAWNLAQIIVPIVFAIKTQDQVASLVNTLREQLEMDPNGSPLEAYAMRNMDNLKHTLTLLSISPIRLTAGAVLYLDRGLMLALFGCFATYVLVIRDLLNGEITQTMLSNQSVIEEFEMME